MKDKHYTTQLREHITSNDEPKINRDPDRFDINCKWARRFLAYRTTANFKHKPLKKESARVYERCLREWVNFLHDQDKNVLDATFDDFVEYLRYCVELGRRTNTIKSRVSVTKMLYRYLVLTENRVNPDCSPLQIDQIRTAAIDELTPDDLERDAIAKEDVEKLFRAVNSERNRLMIVVGIETGFRNSDIRGIRLIDVDLDEPELKAHDPK